MFMHIFRGCSGGNSRGKICSDVLHIDEFSWNTAPCLENCGEFVPTTAFIAFCENMMHLFWEVIQVSAAFLLFKWGWWRHEAHKGFLFSEGIKRKKKNTKLEVTMMKVMMMMLMARRSSSGGLAGSSSHSDSHTIFLRVTSWQSGSVSAPPPLHLIAYCCFSPTVIFAR